MRSMAPLIARPRPGFAVCRSLLAAPVLRGHRLHPHDRLSRRKWQQEGQQRTGPSSAALTSSRSWPACRSTEPASSSSIGSPLRAELAGVGAAAAPEAPGDVDGVAAGLRCAPARSCSCNFRCNCKTPTLPDWVFAHLPSGPGFRRRPDFRPTSRAGVGRCIPLGGRLGGFITP